MLLVRNAQDQLPETHYARNWRLYGLILEKSPRDADKSTDLSRDLYVEVTRHYVDRRTNAKPTCYVYHRAVTVADIDNGVAQKNAKFTKDLERSSKEKWSDFMTPMSTHWRDFVPKTKRPLVEQGPRIGLQAIVSALKEGPPTCSQWLEGPLVPSKAADSSSGMGETTAWLY